MWQLLSKVTPQPLNISVATVPMYAIPGKFWLPAPQQDLPNTRFSLKFNPAHGNLEDT
ncbi:hypothetical protein PGT21_015462 [Puccinia graminis f. sp. tritici]|uniref:Uncharacterized protein n=1 Tax=Puccinia graminis f. sp. tritici TaxID=56615 RepID=A0A5B0LKD2_PUCGR|nr:hypothetical protein PGT21_015462 [Puccinia graminis f. sp. tritici]